MIKLMIADDESGIRKGLMHYIDWSTWDIDLVAEAGDGDEAYAKAIQTQPDILLSDIRMPGRTGLQLAKDLAEVLPTLRVILLTGYNDTAYLQTALKLGIKDYLLKPAGADKIIESVLNVKKEILAERNSHQESVNKDAIINEGIPILQMHFMDDLVKGRLNTNEAILNKAKRLKIPLRFPFLQVGLLRIGESDIFQFHSDKEQSMDTWHLLRTLNTVMEKYEGSFFVELEPELYLWLLGSSSDTNLKKTFRLLSEELSSTLDVKTYPFTAIGIGSVVADLQSLPESYEHARNALARSAWDTKTRVFTRPATPDLNHLEEARRLKKVATQSITQEKFPEAIDFFKAMFDEYRIAQADIEEVKVSCRRLLILATHYCRNIPQTEIDEELLTDIAHLEAFTDANKIYTWMEERLSCLWHGEPTQISPLVSKAQAHIRKHYAEEITIQNLALELFASPNYLGRIFREQTGYKLSDWLNKYRIETAKSLLDNHPEWKIYEVSEKVGFSSYKYFSVCFLKYAGLSARDYRNRPAPKQR
jgi:YesN/AraC family two-component response regulator